MVNGYATGGLDVWAYPFQLLRDYRLTFHEVGSTSSIPGEEILSRVDYEPARICRIYLGPNFVVREEIFVPLDVPGAVFSYSVEASRPIEISVRAKPVLNLMWPGAVGGQETNWNGSMSAFTLSEPLYGYAAVVGSGDITAHDDVVNRAAQGGDGPDLAFTVRVGKDHVSHVYLLLSKEAGRDASYARFTHDEGSLRADAARHYGELRQAVLEVRTPDERVNQAFAWSEVALDQAWVCNADLGCGYVAGYGPTRANRRPQYDWFFAGDGLVAVNAALAEGDWSHARSELEFILRYQNKSNGMIWHELSQSAALIDWAGKFPYMYVHVDTTFDFLAAAAEYVRASGDADFARAFWPQLLAAYKYCLTVIDAKTSLPSIPGDREGANEQEREQDDFDLSVAWVSASAGFAKMADLAGHPDLAHDAEEKMRSARAAIPERYWNSSQAFWASGHTAGGKVMEELRSGPTEALDLHLFSEEREQRVLDHLASSAFQTAWGTRGVALGSAGFDAQSYASGSVWPVGTGPVAESLWNAHRPVSALGVWQTMIAPAFLDSMGHMPEALAGTVYRTQAESVPEQTWSSASFVSATVHGLLGMDVDTVARRVVLAPHTPAGWRDVTLRHARLPEGFGDFSLHRDESGVELDIENSGGGFELAFEPDVALGCAYEGSQFNGRAVGGRLNSLPQQSSVAVTVNVRRGHSELHINCTGGVSVLPEVPEVRVGDPDMAVHVIAVRLDGHTLTIDADVPVGKVSRVIARTQWKAAKADGVAVRKLDESNLELSFAPGESSEAAYTRVHGTIQMEQ